MSLFSGQSDFFRICLKHLLVRIFIKKIGITVRQSVVLSCCKQRSSYSFCSVYNSLGMNILYMSVTIHIITNVCLFTMFPWRLISVIFFFHYEWFDPFQKYYLWKYHSIMRTLCDRENAPFILHNLRHIAWGTWVGHAFLRSKTYSFVTQLPVTWLTLTWWGTVGAGLWRFGADVFKRRRFSVKTFWHWDALVPTL